MLGRVRRAPKSVPAFIYDSTHPQQVRGCTDASLFRLVSGCCDAECNSEKDGKNISNNDCVMANEKVSPVAETVVGSIANVLLTFCRATWTSQCLITVVQGDDLFSIVMSWKSCSACQTCCVYSCCVISALDSEIDTMREGQCQLVSSEESELR